MRVIQVVRWWCLHRVNSGSWSDWSLQPMDVTIEDIHSFIPVSKLSWDGCNRWMLLIPSRWVRTEQQQQPHGWPLSHAHQRQLNAQQQPPRMLRIVFNSASVCSFLQFSSILRKIESNKTSLVVSFFICEDKWSEKHGRHTRFRRTLSRMSVEKREESRENLDKIYRWNRDLSESRARLLASAMWWTHASLFQCKTSTTTDHVRRFS